MTLCDSIKNAEIIKAVCLCYLARYYSKNFKIELAGKLIDKSLVLLKESPFKSDSASVLIANQHYRCFGNYYINKPETYKSIDLLLKTLNEQGFSRLFHKNHNKNIEIPFEKTAVSANDIVELRMNLIRSYNCVGEFDKAFENVLEAEFLYQHMTDCEEDLIVQKAKLFLEKGRTLLRLGKVQEAYEVLAKLFSVREIFSFRFCFFGLLHKSEACIRLKKFEEAYKNCLSALQINLGSNSGGNFGKLSLCLCRYNMAFAKYKMADYKNSLKHFNEFFREAHEFCNNFLSKNALHYLEEQKIFDHVESESQITQCLKKSFKIFTAIYGENHSFVKDYVAPNCL